MLTTVTEVGEEESLQLFKKVIDLGLQFSNNLKPVKCEALHIMAKDSLS